MRTIDADALYRKVKTECNPYGKPTIGFEDGNMVLNWIEQAPTVSGWIPFKRRPPDDEEREDHPDWMWVWDCPLPDDGQEILVSSKRYVWKDEWSDDGDGSGLESGDEIEDGWAWMPMPEPPEEVSGDE